MRRRTKEERVDAWIVWWKKRLLLDKWAIIPQHKDKDLPPDKDERTFMADTVVDLTNSECWMRVYPRMWKETNMYQDMTIGHELSHIHTQPVKEALDKAVRKRAITQKEATVILEDLTNTIAKIVVANARRKKSADYHV